MEVNFGWESPDAFPDHLIAKMISATASISEGPRRVGRRISGTSQEFFRDRIASWMHPLAVRAMLAVVPNRISFEEVRCGRVPSRRLGARIEAPAKKQRWHAKLASRPCKILVRAMNHVGDSQPGTAVTARHVCQSSSP